MKVLVVDDEEDLRVILDINLRRWGHTPLLAESAAVADRILADQVALGDPVDAVLLDVSMPGETGLELIARLDREGRLPPNIVVMSAGMTGRFPDELTDRGIDVMPKPFGVDDLREHVDRMAADRSGTER